MLTQDKKGLSIFDNFVIDRTLPKHVGNEEEIAGNGISFVNMGTGSQWVVSGGNFVEVDDDTDKLNWFQRLFPWNINYSKSDTEPVNDGKSTEEFFKGLKDSFSHIKKKRESDVVDFYLNHISQAQELGQTSLVESLVGIQSTVKSELSLLSCGISKYVTEGDIIKFYKLTDIKNLHLTWIKNFNRIIPFDVFDFKKAADLCKIFDNYVVLHTDITGVSVKETAAERKARIEKEKDPILFGVFKGSKKLYFIGDWEDEYCDLTLEKVMETLEVKKGDKLSPQDIKKSIKSVRHD